MLVLGVDERGYRKKYICEISEEEICKVFNSYQLENLTQDGKKVKLDPGTSINLGEGYDFRNEILEACRKMSEAYNSFSKASATATKFVETVLKHE